MAKKKKSAALEKAQTTVVDHLASVSQMTGGQLAKNHVAIFKKFMNDDCKLLAAIELHFNPVPKTDPDEYAKE